MSAKAWRIYYFNEFFYHTMYFMFVIASVVVLFLQYIYFRKKFLKYNIHRFLITPLFYILNFIAQSITLYGFVTFALARYVYRRTKELIRFRNELLEEYRYHDDYETEGGALVLA